MEVNCMKSHTEIQVICHDSSNVMSGQILNYTEYGCEVRSYAKTTGPVFSLKSDVLLNLLQLKTKSTMTVSARLTSSRFENGFWVYKIKWFQKPPLLDL